MVRMSDGLPPCVSIFCPNFHPNREPEICYLKISLDPIAWVGESPGRKEEKEWIPFCGPASRIQESICVEAGFSFKRGTIFNAARCKIHKDRHGLTDIRAILYHCNKRLAPEISDMKPKLIICLGDIATYQILENGNINQARIPGTNFSEIRGKFYWSDYKCWVLPTFHPAYILRNPSKRKFVVEDMKRVKKFIENGWRK